MVSALGGPVDEHIGVTALVKGTVTRAGRRVLARRRCGRAMSSGPSCARAEWEIQIYRTVTDEIRSFQVCPSRNLRVRRSETLLRNSSLPRLKLRSLKTVTRDPPKICRDEMLSPNSPGRLSSLSPLVTQKRSP